MKPLTRIEQFLAKIAGNKDAKDIAPKTRIEHFLNDIAEADVGKELPDASSLDDGMLLGVASGEWSAVYPELPDATDLSDGKVLTVADGSWVAADPKEKFIVHIEGNNDNYSIDKEFEDIVDQFENGKDIIFMHQFTVNSGLSIVVDDDEIVGFDVPFIEVNPRVPDLVYGLFTINPNSIALVTTHYTLTAENVPSS